MAHKRSHGEVDAEDDEATPSTTKPSSQPEPPDDHDNAAAPEEWQVVESRSKRRKKVPRKESDKYPSITHSSHARLQSFVKIGDLQNLVLYIMADGHGPQWCSIKHHGNTRKVVILMVPGLEMGMFDGCIDLPCAADSRPKDDKLEDNSRSQEAGKDTTSEYPIPKLPELARKALSPDDFYPQKLKRDRLPSQLQPLAEIFEHVWPVKTPGDDKYAKMHSPLTAMLIANIPKVKEEKKKKGPGPPAEANGWCNRRTRLTEFVATFEELLGGGFVVHPAHFSDHAEAEAYQRTRKANKTTIDDGWVETPGIEKLSDGDVLETDIQQGAVSAGRSILAIDCEMCITSPPDVQPPVYSLTRMSVIDWDGKVVLDELVKPEAAITNYLTPYSGITSKMLEGVTTTLHDAQRMLLGKITPQTILVGHSLDSDLNALRLSHPFIIDTSFLYPHPRGPPLKSSLKWLATKYLNRTIQAGHGSVGHDSVEDALASLDLVKQKCERGKTWGTSDASSESIFRRLAHSNRPKRFKVHPDGEDEPRTGAVVDWGEPKRGYGSQAKMALGCKTDQDVVEGVAQSVNGKDPEVDPNGVDVVWARLRELEAYQGWWNTSKTADIEALREAALDTHENDLLGDVVAGTVQHIQQIWNALPSCTVFIIYTGSGDPRKLYEMQEMKQKHKAEYAVKKWDELSVRWTDIEEKALQRACQAARRGLALIAVK